VARPFGLLVAALIIGSRDASTAHIRQPPFDSLVVANRVTTRFAFLRVADGGLEVPRAMPTDAPAMTFDTTISDAPTRGLGVL